MKKYAIALVFAAAIGFVGWLAYHRYTAARARVGRRPGAAVAIEVAEVRRTTMRELGRFTGTLRASSRFTVAPKIPGRLERLLVDIGDAVERNQLVAVLEDDEHVQRVEQARAELRVARANVEGTRSAVDFARREFKRIEALRGKDFSSESELDASEAEYKCRHAAHQIALAQVVQKEAALQAARVRLSYTRIHAPWQGTDRPRVVGERFADEGAMLAAGSPIVSILDIRSLVAAIHVIERDYAKVRVGQEVAVETDACPGRVFAGRVARVAPMLKEESRKARVEVEVPNPERLLKPGMFVRARIEFARREDATVVPVEALARRDGRRGVFFIDTEEKRARFVPVTLGVIDGDLAEVVEPPLSGLVATMGQHLLEDGSAVTVESPDPPGGEGR